MDVAPAGIVAHVKLGGTGDASFRTDFPTGTMLPFAGPTPPPGWLMCDGAAVSRITYFRLFTVIGDTYGAGDGRETFNLPDTSGRMLIGTRAADLRWGGSPVELGKRGGSETATLPSFRGPTSAFDPDGESVCRSAWHDQPKAFKKRSNIINPFLAINYMIAV